MILERRQQRHSATAKTGLKVGVVWDNCKSDTLSPLQWQHQCGGRCQYVEEALAFSDKRH
jgi:hypothetical protein